MMVKPKTKRRIQVEEAMPSSSDPVGMAGSLSMNWVARGMQNAAISTITKMAQMAQKHTGDLLQQPLLDMLGWAGLGCCCLPGN